MRRRKPTPASTRCCENGPRRATWFGESHFKIRVTAADPVLDTTTDSGVEVFVRKPDLMRVDFKDAKGNFQHSFVCRGRTIHQWDASKKEDVLIPLPPEFGFPEKPERYPDGFLNSLLGKGLEWLSWLSFGPPVRDLKGPSHLRLSKEDDKLDLSGDQAPEAEGIGEISAGYKWSWRARRSESAGSGGNSLTAWRPPSTSSRQSATRRRPLLPNPS